MMRAREGERARARMQKSEASGEVAERYTQRKCVKMREKDGEIESGKRQAYIFRAGAHLCV
jgi:hypothetical protein